MSKEELLMKTEIIPASEPNNNPPKDNEGVHSEEDKKTSSILEALKNLISPSKKDTIDDVPSKQDTPNVVKEEKDLLLEKLNKLEMEHNSLKDKIYKSEIKNKLDDFGVRAEAVDFLTYKCLNEENFDLSEFKKNNPFYFKNLNSASDRMNKINNFSEENNAFLTDLLKARFDDSYGQGLDVRNRTRQLNSK